MEMIEQFRAETSMDFVILTNEDAHDDLAALADDFYDNEGYGIGDENSGILYLIDMYERTPYLSTAGAMIDYMTDGRIEEAHNQTYGYLASSDYADAAAAMITAVANYVKRGIPEGQYQYDVITGERLTSRHNALTPGEIGMSALAAAIVAFGFMRIVNRSYNLKGSTYEYNFRENSQVRLTNSVDDYLRTSTTRVKKAETSSSSGGGRSGASGVHRSSGGVRHGGGAGRKF